MSSTAVVFALFTITCLGVTAFRDQYGNVIKDMTARKHAEYLDRIEGIHCPPLGLTDRFNVSVIDAGGSRVSGCSYIQRNPSVSPSQLFHLWLRRSKNSSVGHCGDLENMDHFMFECLSKTHENRKEEDESGWKYVSLFQHSIFEHYTRYKQNESNRLGYRCALYNMAPENQDVILMVISENMNEDEHAKCEDLWETLEYGPNTPKGQPLWPDRSVVLILDREVVEPELRKRSVVQDDGSCSFPDWSQGLWSEIQVYGNIAYYSNEFYEENDVEDTRENRSESTTTFSHYQEVQQDLPQENIQRTRRNSIQQSQQQQIKMTRFKWRCTMSVDDNEQQLQRNETEAKFLTYGGRIVEKNVLNSSNNTNNGQESGTLDDIAETTTKTYGCLLLQSRGHEICYSIIGTGMLEKNQDIQKFALELCKEKKVFYRGFNVMYMKKICARRPHLSI